MPGVYRLDVPDAVFASGVNSAIVMLKGATNMEPSVIEFALEAVNAQDAVRMGLTALPNANAEAAGGLYTRGTGAGQINQPANGMADVNVVRNAGTAITASAGRQEVNVSHYGGNAGTFSGGRPEVNTTHAAGTAWNSGAIGANTLATDTITAAKIAADAIGASELAADAVTEIQSGLATAANLATVAGYLDTEIAAILADTNELQTDWANGGRLDLILDARASQSSVDTMQGNVTDILADTADMQPKLGTPAGASLAADIAAIEAQTDDIGTAGAGLSAVPWNAAWDAEVQSEVADALAAYGVATATNVTDAAANVSVDEIQATALADLFNTDSGTTYASAVAGSVVKEIADNAGGSSLTAADIADAVWDEAISGHAGSGSTGEALAAAGGAGDPWITSLPGSYTAGQAGYIVGTNLNATVSSRASQASVDDVPTNAELATALGTADDAVLAQIALVKAKTDSLPADPADASDIASLVDALPTAAENATAIWAAGTRTLTAIDEDSTTIDLDAAIRAAVGMASANLDTQIGDLPTNAELATALDDLPTAAENATAVLGATVEGSVTLVQSIRLANAALGGKASGLDTTNPIYRDLADTKDRIDATVDADGNRSAVTRDLT